MIALVNQKGGVGKTTTTLNLGFALGRAGWRVLLVDLDPQASLSQGLGLRLEDPEESMFAVLDAGEPLEKIIQELVDDSENYPAEEGGGGSKSVNAKANAGASAGANAGANAGAGVGSGRVAEGSFPGGSVDLAPAHVAMTSLDSRLQDQIGSHGFLKEALDEVRQRYDFVLVDCRPSLDTLEINALYAADYLIVPVETYRYSLYATKDLAEFYTTVRKRLNPRLEILGVLFTRVESRTRISREVIGLVSGVFREEIFTTQIRKNVRLAEVPGAGDSVFDYAPASHGAEDYRDLAQEVMDRVR